MHGSSRASVNTEFHIFSSDGISGASTNAKSKPGEKPKYRKTPGIAGIKISLLSTQPKLPGLLLFGVNVGLCWLEAGASLNNAAGFPHTVPH